jgi:CheY-like chemotaxis protein
MSQLLLYIDDDDEDLDIFREALNETNLPFKCITTRDGLEGLAILESNVPQYIFLDVHMPIMNGFQILKTIRTQTRLKEVPVIMVSTAFSNENELLKDGATSFMVKPATISEYCITLKALLT